jgi:hypothetical protein
VLKQSGLEYLLLPVFSIASCLLNFSMDPRLHLITGAL